MIIDIDRLETDAAYWDEVAPEGATQFGPEEGCYLARWYKNKRDKAHFMFVDGNRWHLTDRPKRDKIITRPKSTPEWLSTAPDWATHYCNAYKAYRNSAIEVIADCCIPLPRSEKPMRDDCMAARIGEIGNQIHNLGCDHQNDEDLSDRLGKLASALWDLADLAPTETEWVNGLPPVGTECEVYDSEDWYRAEVLKQYDGGVFVFFLGSKSVGWFDTFRPFEPATEWDEEDAIPPVGCECGLTIGARMVPRAKITYVGDGVFCYVDVENGNEYTGNLLDAIFTPRKSKASRDREELVKLIADCRMTPGYIADVIIAEGWEKS